MSVESTFNNLQYTVDSLEGCNTKQEERSRIRDLYPLPSGRADYRLPSFKDLKLDDKIQRKLHQRFQMSTT